MESPSSKPHSSLPSGALFWECLDLDQWSKITQIIVYKKIGEFILVMDSLASLMHNNPSDLESLILIQITPWEGSLCDLKLLKEANNL